LILLVIGPYYWPWTIIIIEDIDQYYWYYYYCIIIIIIDQWLIIIIIDIIIIINDEDIIIIIIINWLLWILLMILTVLLLLIIIDIDNYYYYCEMTMILCDDQLILMTQWQCNEYWNWPMTSSNDNVKTINIEKTVKWPSSIGVTRLLLLLMTIMILDYY